MTISIAVGSTTLSGFTWYSMTPMSATVEYVEHNLTGASYSLIYVTSKGSCKSTITGYCRNTSANVEAIESMKGPNVTLTVTDSNGVEHEGVCLAADASPTAGNLWLTVSVTFAEQ